METPLTERANKLITQWLDEEIVCSETIKGGNNLILKCCTRSDRRFVVKHYVTPRDDGQDRLSAEFSAVRFMHDSGIDNIPQPLFCDHEERIGVYGYIEGRRLEANELETCHIDIAVEFLGRLASLRGLEAGEVIGLASDACPSLDSYSRNVSRRLEKFQQIPLVTPMHYRASKFIQQELLPVFFRTSERLALGGVAQESDGKLSAIEMTLSPSDFGFHNALLGWSGRLYFLDFEYFGWDDPAKMIADFLHHPGFCLRDTLSERFRTQALLVFADDSTVEARLNLVYPMVGLNWCLILLKKFLSTRTRGNGEKGGRRMMEEILEAQLNKSMEKLAAVKSALS